MLLKIQLWNLSRITWKILLNIYSHSILTNTQNDQELSLIQNQLAHKMLLILHVSTKDQITDIFTEDLSRTTHSHLLPKLRVCSTLLILLGRIELSISLVWTPTILLTKIFFKQTPMILHLCQFQLDSHTAVFVVTKVVVVTKLWIPLLAVQSIHCNDRESMKLKFVSHFFHLISKRGIWAG